MSLNAGEPQIQREKSQNGYGCLPPLSFVAIIAGHFVTIAVVDVLMHEVGILCLPFKFFDRGLARRTLAQNGHRE